MKVFIFIFLFCIEAKPMCKNVLSFSSFQTAAYVQTDDFKKVFYILETALINKNIKIKDLHEQMQFPLKHFMLAIKCGAFTRPSSEVTTTVLQALKLITLSDLNDRINWKFLEKDIKIIRAYLTVIHHMNLILKISDI